MLRACEYTGCQSYLVSDFRRTCCQHERTGGTDASPMEMEFGLLSRYIHSGASTMRSRGEMQFKQAWSR